MTTQPDVEIYVKDAGTDELRAWLEGRLGPLAELPARGALRRYTAQWNGHELPVHLMPGAVGKAWTSVWIDASQTPWADDLACARDCFAALGKQVRCAAGSWHDEDDDPDAFIRIDATGESHISWKTE
jgi:hypothetical protein